jgi:hypothetical protein
VPAITPSDQLSTRSRIGKAARLAAAGLGACLLIVLALSVWNLTMAKWQHERNPVPGVFYAVGGREMHIDCSGNRLPRCRHGGCCERSLVGVAKGAAGAFASNTGLLI